MSRVLSTIVAVLVTITTLSSQDNPYKVAQGWPQLPAHIKLGGVISVEFASYYRSFGVEVSIVELLPTLIPLMDSELGTQLARSFKKRGHAFRSGSTSLRARGSLPARRS